MAASIFFWSVMALWLVVQVAPHVRSKSLPTGTGWTAFLPWVALAALGWRCFWPIVQG